MRIMKILSVLAIIFSFTQCGSSKFITNPPFEIVFAEYYKCTSEHSKISGLEVKIKLKQNTAINFDSLYFKNKVTKIKKKEASMLIANFNTLKNYPSDLILDIDSKKEINNKLPKLNKFPFKLNKNEAVLSYQLAGETKYFKIKNLKEIDTSLFSKTQ